MVREFLYNYVTQNHVTLLCVGPMSRNCVDTAIALANQHQIPMKMIASRRQIECAAMGSGYVENWSTEQFVEHVRARDTGGYVFLARDHGGPWQHPSESKMDLKQAMKSARDSFTVDIESGMQIIHVDPSVDPHGTPTYDQLLERVLDLYTHCHEVALRKKRDIAFEVGTEEQGVGVHTTQEFERVLRAITQGCATLNLPQPLFVVSQTGTKVMERRNIGSFEEFTEGREPRELGELLAICNRHGVLMKEHNTDYLSDQALSLHPKIGIHAANVAPEFGVVETLTLLQIMETMGFKSLADRFLTLAYNSRKWEKWMLPESHADDRERAIICGHYVFAKPEFLEIKDQLSFALGPRGVDLNEELRKALAASMLRYLSSFGMLPSKSQKKVG